MMNYKKTVRGMVSWLLAIALVVACAPTSANAAKKIKLNKKSVKLQVGKTAKLKLKNNKKKVKWSSTNRKIATVSKSGLVKAKKKGKTKIIAKVQKKKYICKVTVIAKKTTTGTNPGGSVTATAQPDQTPGSSETPKPGSSENPSPGGNGTPVPGGKETPIPGGNETPVPGGNETPTPGGNETPVPGGNETPIPGGNETPTPTPGENPTPTPGQTETPGQNVELPSGATVFTLGTRKLAIGMSKTDVYTVLGSSADQEMRDNGKSPQGFDVIACNTKDYKEYLLIYLKDDLVAGICGIGGTMSYGDAAAGDYGTNLSSEWKNVSDYKTTGTSKAVGARTKMIAANECAYAFYDALGDNQIYCIQVFDPTKIRKADDDMIFATSNLNYDSVVNASIATETGKMLNAFRAYYGKTVFILNAKLAQCAQDHCNQAATNGVNKISSRGDEMFEILYSYGVSAGNYDEQCYTGAADAVSFANSLIEDVVMHDDLIGSEAGTWRYLGVGMAASSAHSYMTIDCVDMLNW